MSDLIERGLRELIERIVDERLAAQSSAKQLELVTIADYAAARSISATTVRAAIKDGRLAATRFGRAVRVRADAEIGEPVRTSKPQDDKSWAGQVIAGGRR